MHEYVQKSTRTTFPRSWRRVSGLLLIQFERPASSGAAPRSRSVVSDETRVEPRSFWSSLCARPFCSTFFCSDSVYPGSAVWKWRSTLSAIASAVSATTTPRTCRIRCACGRSAVIPARPPNATMSMGIAAPVA